MEEKQRVRPVIQKICIRDLISLNKQFRLNEKCTKFDLLFLLLRKVPA